jgi:hypothetical protein
MKSFILAVALLLSINVFSQDTAAVRESSEVVKFFNETQVAKESSDVKFYFINADTTGHMRCDARVGSKLTRFYVDSIQTVSLGGDTTVQLMIGRFYFSTPTERIGRMSTLFVGEHLVAISFLMGKLTLIYIIKPNPLSLYNAL